MQTILTFCRMSFLISWTLNKVKQTENPGVELIKWEDIRVGDILKLQHGELAPADMILLDSNIIRDKLPICYINTL